MNSNNKANETIDKLGNLVLTPVGRQGLVEEDEDKKEK
jgi:hypothetical protein